MQYVRNLSDSVSTAWNSINPATLSGAIDVIVVEQEDGSLMCSPFHVRFGKFSLLRPYEKKVEFKVNGARQDYSMKLGEGGEAFFVFETTDNIPQSMQTSPISSPVSSPSLSPQASLGLGSAQLQEPELLALDSAGAGVKSRSSSHSLRSPPTVIPTILAASAQQRNGLLTPLSASPETYAGNLKAGDWSAWSQRAHSDDVLPKTLHQPSDTQADSADGDATSTRRSERSRSPPPLAPPEALERALTLSRELSSVNIPSRVTDSGDLMLDLTSFKGSEEDALRAEILARRVLSNELQGNYDVGALFGMDEQGNLWIYSSEEAKEAAMKRVMESSMGGGAGGGNGSSGPLDAVSDPGYQSDDSSGSVPGIPKHRRTESDVGGMADRNTPPSSPGLVSAVGDPNRNYAKTLRLTSDQLKALDLQPGENTMSFTVNRATCSAYMYLWKNDVPVVISDIDGTITKSDALGHVLNMIGRDWTHAGVAKLYSDIVANGYNIMYLTSRSVGQADSTRTYLHGILQGGYRLPRGPTILSPDRTMAALRREIYLRKPEVFKMATLRDIRNLYGSNSHPFYAGFGNRLTDQISYRTVDVPRNRIFTINANAEVSLDLLSLNQLKLTYVNITEVVDHYFPPVSTLVKGGGEDYTDFRYWRDAPLELDDFSASESDDDDIRGRRTTATHSHSRYEVEEEEEDDEEMDEEDDLDDEEAGEGMGDSYISRNSMDEYGEGSILSGEYDNDGHMMDSMIAEEHDGRGEDEEEDVYEDEEEGGEDEVEEVQSEEEAEEVVTEEVGEGDAEGDVEGDVESEDVTEKVDDNSEEVEDAAPVTLAATEEVNLADSTPANGRVSEASQVSEATTTTEDVGAELITGIEKLSVEVVPAKEDESAGAM